ncbi:MAG TPA: hypothetical protein VJ738_16795 [Steroidobacteraceae bacterium]|nr:hypothetical protein [Steroidobacteraceae bacterium]
MSEFDIPDGGLERVLDRALGRALQPPRVSADFRRRLQAALSRAGETDLSELRSRLEGERRAQLADLESRYVRLRRKTLGALIGAAFATGTALALTLPWLERHFGADTPLVLTSGGAAAGLAIAFLAWRAHARGDAV